MQKGLYSKFRNNVDFKQSYNKFLEKYDRLGHMTNISQLSYSHVSESFVTLAAILVYQTSCQNRINISFELKIQSINYQPPV